jgi:molybdopterin-guanine dinucleotide biosynthesis protein
VVTEITTEKALWRLIVVGGHTRSIGKTQLVCDVIRAFPRVEWIAGKITQYGHGVCARNGENCDCAPEEHVCALDWETHSDTGTDSARFLQAGAKRSFWLRTKQGYLAEGLPLLREALREVKESEGLRAVIVESNSLMQFVKPSLYFAVVDPLKDDFKESAQTALDRAHALVLRGDVGENPAPLWMRLPERLMREKPSVLQREGEKLPEPLWELVHRILEQPPSVKL